LPIALPHHRKSQPKLGVIVASGGVVEIVTALGEAAFFVSLAKVIVAWLGARSARKIMIQTHDNQNITIEGYSEQRIAKILEHAKSFHVIQTEADAESKDSET
jgi:hypothetical protein